MGREMISGGESMGWDEGTSTGRIAAKERQHLGRSGVTHLSLRRDGAVGALCLEERVAFLVDYEVCKPALKGSLAWDA